MGLQAPGSVVAGSSFQASYSFQKDKTGGVVAIIPGGPRSLFIVTINQAGMLEQLGTLTSAPMTGRSGTVTLVAPAQPGSYGIVTVYGPDGGTIDTGSLLVTAAAAAPSTTSTTAIASTAAVASGYSPPSPEPKASDGQTLSQQGADVQLFYVQNYGPGILAATQFVIDHEHQLAAIGSSSTSSTAAVATTLPAGPGAGGPDTGLFMGGGGGGAFSSTNTPTVPNQRQTGAPPPSVGSIVSDLTGNPVLLIGAGVLAFVLFSGGHRR